MRADIPFFCLTQNFFSCVRIALRQHLVHRRVDAVKVALRARAVDRIALGLVEDAHFFFRGQGDGLEFQSFCFQDGDGLLRYCAGDCFRRQIKEPVAAAPADGADGRKDRGHRFADAGRGLHEEFFFPQNRAVDTAHQFPLAFPVREGEFEVLHRSVACFLPLILKFCPDKVGVEKLIEPLLQLGECVRLQKMADAPVGVLRFYFFFCERAQKTFLLGGEQSVCHQHAHLLFAVLAAVDVGVAFCLRQMYRNRLFHRFKIAVRSLDLLDHGCCSVLVHAVCSALDAQAEMLVFFFVHQRNLRTVIAAPLFLDLLMHPRSRLHRIALAETSRRVVQIPAAQNKLYQIPHGNPDLLLFLFHLPFCSL